MSPVAVDAATTPATTSIAALKASNGTPATDPALEAAKAAIRPNPVKAKLLAGKVAHSCSVKLVGSIEVVEMIASAGFDGMLIDLEHSSFSLSTANQLSCTALSAGITPIVRVPANSSDWISRCLDGGAQAVIVPHVNSAEEARNVVKYSRFFPLGERSATSGLPHLRYKHIPAKYANGLANDATLVIVMIETQLAVDRALDIASVQGVDVLLIGTNDLSADMGIPGAFDDPRISDAYAKVTAAAKQVSVDGRHVAVGVGGLHSRMDLVEKFLKGGAQYVMSATDGPLLLGAMNARTKAMDALSSVVEQQ